MSFLYAILLFLPLFTSINGAVEAESINESLIFGVRWFLGEKFRFQEAVTFVQKQVAISHLLLFFNTVQQWPQVNFAVLIEGKSYGCIQERVNVEVTANHHKNFNEVASDLGSNSTFFIHKCRILFQQQTFLQEADSFAYAINANNHSQNILLFTSRLRSPSFRKAPIALTVFGDWGVMSNYSKQSNLSQPISDCLQREIESRKDIRVMLLLGDLAYDLEGASYVNFFKYLQPFSSQLAILMTPGNHQSIKHKDIYQLVKHSFYSPFWAHFYGYFDMVKLGDYVFVGYSSEAFFPGLAKDSNSSLFQEELEEEFGDFFTLFELQFSQETKKQLRMQTVVGYSHYPIFCSQEDEHQSCDNYQKQHLPLLSHLQDAGMALFFSGHLHFYERSRQICRQGGQLMANQQVRPSYQLNDGCTIFVLQGAGGNNYYVQTSRHFALKNHSQRFIDNTGFGVLSLPFEQSPAHYRHVLAGQSCPVADQMYLTLPAFKITRNDRLYSILIIIATLLAILALLRLQRSRRSQRMLSLSSKSTTNVLQMIQADSLH